MAMAIGKRDIPEAGRILGQSFVLNFGAAVVFTTIRRSHASWWTRTATL
jgi:Na+-driven multidrug efflux pump